MSFTYIYIYIYIYIYMHVYVYIRIYTHHTIDLVLLFGNVYLYIYLLKTELRILDFNIFIGSPDTGYQLIYLHYQIWSIKASMKKAE